MQDLHILFSLSANGQDVLRCVGVHKQSSAAANQVAAAVSMERAAVKAAAGRKRQTRKQAAVERSTTQAFAERRAAAFAEAQSLYFGAVSTISESGRDFLKGEKKRICDESDIVAKMLHKYSAALKPRTVRERKRASPIRFGGGRKAAYLVELYAAAAANIQLQQVEGKANKMTSKAQLEKVRATIVSNPDMLAFNTAHPQAYGNVPSVHVPVPGTRTKFSY
eukprot:SAG11_NODE_20_length_25330_cov_18.348143_15_plen_222_part_00